MSRMSRVFSVAILGAAISVCQVAGAQDSLYVGDETNDVATMATQPAFVPAGVQLVELERWIYRDNRFSARPAASYQTHPGRREGVIGFVSFTEFPGSVPIFACVANDYSDQFSSRDPGCEGHKPKPSSPITGHIASTQLTGTVPLYRCMRTGLSGGRWGDHFDTTSADCERKYPANFEGILGYIWK